MSRIRSNLASRVKKGRMSQAAADAAMAKVKGVLDYSDFGEQSLYFTLDTMLIIGWCIVCCCASSS